MITLTLYARGIVYLWNVGIDACQVANKVTMLRCAIQSFQVLVVGGGAGGSEGDEDDMGDGGDRQTTSP